jgi:tRNA(Arg) A34 adenosine deaminase TadA
MTDKRTILMRRALTLACDSVAAGGGPFGAVIARDGAIVAEGVNCVTLWNDPTAHAEVVAVRAACQALGRFDLRGCEIYSSCEPCPMCLGAIHWARLERIHFAADRFDAARAGFDDDLLYREFARPIDARQTPISRLLEEMGAAPFEAWLRHAGRVTY